jgi:hypothetical protein
MNRTAATDAPSNATASPLSGGWLLAIRVGWLLSAIASLAPFMWSLRDYLDGIRHPTPDNAALPPQAVSALLRFGITLDAYAWMSLAVICAVTLVSLVIALALVWRRGDDWMALLVSAFLINYTTTNIGVPTNPSAVQGLSVSAALTVFWGAYTFALPLSVFLLFPTGRFAPRWAWAVLVAAALWAGAITVAPNLLDGVLILGYPVFLGGVIAIMIYRYRRASTPIQRLQTKWIVAGLVVTVVANQLFWIPTGFTPLGQTIYPPLFYLAYELILSLAPVTFFIAIQRYHLYNIDRIINRALVYGSLTAILAALYFGLIVGVQTLIRLFTGQGPQSPALIVLSTLLIAALVQPLRRGLQTAIDQRFYRRKYDAARTLQAFGASLRQEVELDELSAHLLEVVDETMRPARVSLWLRAATTEETRPERLTTQ